MRQRLTCTVTRVPPLIFVFALGLLLLAACTPTAAVEQAALREAQPLPEATATQAATATALPTPAVVVQEPADTPTPPPTATAAAAAAAAPARPGYELTAVLDPATKRLDVKQVVRIVNDTPDVWQEAVFNVSPAYWPTVFDLGAVRVGRDVATREVFPTLDVTMLRVPLTPPVAPGEPVTVAIDYGLNLPPVDPEDWNPEGNAGWSPEVFQLGDWYPTLVPYTAAGWQTWEFRPVGDPVINRLADFDVTVTLPAGYTVVAPGQVEDGVAHFRLGSARSFTFFASQAYVLLEDEVDGVPIRVYVTEKHERLGPVVLATAVRALPFFTELYGPYPYDELIIAENGYLASMEYSAFVSLSADLFVKYRQGTASLLESLVVHEIAHQWWYGSVGNDQVREPWLDESMAMVSELLYYDAFFPELVDAWWQSRVEFTNATGPVNATIYDYFDSQAFMFETYSRAAYFMADLRELMGHESFNAFLRDYAAAHRNQFVTREDFFAAVGAHTTADLTPLLEEYFTGE